MANAATTAPPEGGTSSQASMAATIQSSYSFRSSSSFAHSAAPVYHSGLADANPVGVKLERSACDGADGLCELRIGVKLQCPS